MRKKLLALILLAIMALTIAHPVQAGGDKVRGDNGLGSVVQVQVMDPPPFQP